MALFRSMHWYKKRSTVHWVIHFPPGTSVCLAPKAVKAPSDMSPISLAQREGWRQQQYMALPSLRGKSHMTWHWRSELSIVEVDTYIMYTYIYIYTYMLHVWNVLPTFTINFRWNVGKYTIHGASGIYFACRLPRCNIWWLYGPWYMAFYQPHPSTQEGRWPTATSFWFSLFSSVFCEMPTFDPCQKGIFTEKIPSFSAFLLAFPREFLMSSSWDVNYQNVYKCINPKKHKRWFGKSWISAIRMQFMVKSI